MNTAGNISEQQAATLTVNDVHSAIGRDKIARATLYLAIARSELPSVRIGKRILIPREAFEAWLQGKVTAPRAEARAR